MSKKHTLLITYLFACGLFNLLHAQEEEGESIKDKVKKNVGVSGGIGYSSTFYDMSGAPNQRPPHFWQLTANLNINAGPINLPFSARFSPAGNDGAYPTIPTQIGLSPNYKAWTLHLGWRSLKFSDFSVSGNQFVGAGVEYKPEKKIIVRALGGRFVKSNIEYDPNRIVVGSPAYERWGGGAQVVLGSDEKHIGFHLFKAKDDPNSLPGSDTLLFSPSDNLVYGVTGSYSVNENISLFGEYTISAITQDIRIEEGIQSNYSYLNNLGNTFYSNPTTVQNKAINVGTNIKIKSANLKLAYRRVDPGYRSLGAIYLNNDLEDVTSNLSFSVLKRKMNISLTGGIQRNNLDADKMTRTNRLIGALAINYAPNEKWNFGGNYSNFTTNTEQTLVQEGFDTLRFAQVTTSGSLNAARMFNREKTSHTIMGLSNYQEAVSNGDRLSQNYLNMLTYSLVFKKLKLSTNASYSFNKTIAGGIETDLNGPTVGAAKSLLGGKLNAGLSASYLNTKINQAEVGNILTSRVFSNLKIGKHHGFNASYSFVQRDLTTQTEVSRESILIVGYQFTF